MSASVWYCPLCQSEGTDPSVEFCTFDGARVRPIAMRGMEWIGKVLEEKYRVVRFIDAGGTAEVYEAERIATGKRVAVKLLHAGFATSPDAHERFLKEAQLVSRIAHQNVVEIFDFGTLPESVHFMVMELLSGRTLETELMQVRVPVLTALKYAMQACEGLAAAHERGVIHCDIKPANLFLQQLPGTDEVVVKLLDLGVGRLVAGLPNVRPEESSFISGTPDYMSPEQATAQALGPATDIYAMGIVLYEMLLGRLPFEDASIVEVLTKQVNDAPKWHADLAKSRGVPPEAEAVVLRALSKRPEMRQASMMDLQRDLAALMRLVRGRTTGPNRVARDIASTTGTHPTQMAMSPSPQKIAPVRARSTSQSSRPQIVKLAEATGTDREVVEIAPGAYWVGRRKGESLECNAYLRVFKGNGTEVAILVDPGPPSDFEIISSKVAAVIGSIRRLDFIFVNHQDPDVSSNAAAIQQASSRAHIWCSEDTWRLIHTNGLDRKRYSPTERFPGGIASLATGHQIQFVPTPFCHFRGAVMLYDPETGVLFSGDLFGGALSTGFIGSGTRWWSGVEMFHQIYMPSSRALALAAARIRRLDPAPKIIAPQHGSVIVGDSIGPVVDAMSILPVGLDVTENAGSDAKSIAAANDIVHEYGEIAGKDRARKLLAGYGEEGSFTNPFVIRNGIEITGFKVAPYVAIEALSNDALATLSAERRGELQRTLRSIRSHHKLDAASRTTPSPVHSRPPPEEK